MPHPVIPPNPPGPTRRARQAEQTRAEILVAARQRFAAAGFAGTSMKQIAGDAGVSVQTVYDSVGSKTDVVRSLNDLIDGEARVWEVAAGLETATDANEIVAIPARITRRIVERCGDIVRAVAAGSQAESELAPVAEEGGRRHRAGAEKIAELLDGFGALRTGLLPADAARTIAVLADFRVALVLIDDFGFTFDEVEQWMGDTIARAVLGE
ncbi:MAG: TetR/AcrR family transcriptional regulator [Actinobacteria bacterium]|nr:TetR/AcrR family transcriptional regulator [Actinomycetota bacterium]